MIKVEILNLYQAYLTLAQRQEKYDKKVHIQSIDPLPAFKWQPLASVGN